MTSATHLSFSATISPETARRQFQLSVALVVLLAVGAVTVALTAGIRPRPAAERTAVTTIIQTPHLVQTRQASARTARTGG